MCQLPSWNVYFMVYGIASTIPQGQTVLCFIITYQGKSLTQARFTVLPETKILLNFCDSMISAELRLNILFTLLSLISQIFFFTKFDFEFCCCWFPECPLKPESIQCLERLFLEGGLLEVTLVEKKLIQSVLCTYLSDYAGVLLDFPVCGAPEMGGYLMVIWWFFDGYLMVFWWLFDGYLMVISSSSFYIHFFKELSTV